MQSLIPMPELHACNTSQSKTPSFVSSFAHCPRTSSLFSLLSSVAHILDQTKALPHSFAKASNSFLDLLKWSCGIRSAEEKRIVIVLGVGVEPGSTHHKSTVVNRSHENILVDLLDGFGGRMWVLAPIHFHPVLCNVNSRQTKERSCQ